MNFPFSLLKEHKTPFYFYDLSMLQSTIDEVKSCIAGKPVKVHYALKANANPKILELFVEAGFGADCVSGGEIEAAIKAGFTPGGICYAGVGKTDEEIIKGLEYKIGCFNVESIEELEVIAELAKAQGCRADVCLRVNPDIDAHTHHYITTGLEENKFGIHLSLLPKAVEIAKNSSHLHLAGLHFHIGSQITDMTPFKLLCEKVNGLVEEYEGKGIRFEIINLGGGLGVDYDDPDGCPVPDFKTYFSTILENLKLRDYQQVHVELGRSLVAQCGSLISKVTYVKKGINRDFIILDAGMNDLIRPALYGAHHKIENLSAPSDAPLAVYDVVGPICESSDVFGKEEKLPLTKRGDYVALRSAGAYGETMSSHYNLRPIPSAVCG